MKKILSLLALSAFATTAHAAPCAPQQGFGAEGCVVVSGKMLISVPEIDAGVNNYTIAAQITFDKQDNAQLAAGNALCADFGGKKMLSFTYDYAGDGQVWTDVALISAKDGSFVGIDSQNQDYKMDTLTCSI